MIRPPRPRPAFAVLGSVSGSVQRALLATALWALALGVGGCSGGSEAFHPGVPVETGTGGSGAGPSATGGGAGGAPVSGSGGVASGTGGSATAVASGGRSGTASGGALGTGGASASGGRTGTGGAVAQVPGAVLLTDDFEDGNTLGWLQDPSDVAGKWAVAAEGATKTLQESVVTSDISWMVGGHVDWTNQRVEARIKVNAFTDSGAMIFVASRFVDFDHYYFTYLKADGSMKIRKRIAGSTTDLIPSFKTGLTITPGATHTIGMSVANATVTMYLDGVAVASAPDVGATVAAGGIALGAQKVAASFDDVKVTAP